ncbi:EmrB/QacA subfamily drug resistance transporter [Saccharopolyspora dendranthemae]|uniref:EmrB/QacA subfamily drug resistance transporter n=1 Tax=Saccharopolyspora dendranthemae TaxID=1181886 RepID=A0A561U2G7_9PSEU|nr:EmrB/QacA subfamily drug resistance transporter [Saccharopolyspora dendranthemae]
MPGALRRVNPQVAVCVCYVAAMFMNGMDATIVNVALPALVEDFSVSASSASSVNVGYLVSLAVCIPVSGWLGDRYGTKRVFLAAFGVFVLASALCGVSGDLLQLTLARVLQGAGGGVMSPVALTLLFRAYPPAERIRLSRVLLLPTAVAPALGPVLGGFFVEHLTWRWGFFVNLPVGVAALVFGALLLQEHVEAPGKRFDLRGFALAAPGLGLVVFALEGVATGAPAALNWFAGAAGIALLAVLVRAQLRTEHPMLDLRLFADNHFRRASLILFTCLVGFLGTLYGFTLMYQVELGASAWETGLVTLPKAVGLMIASQLVGWAHRRFGPRLLIAVAMAGASLSFALMNAIGPHDVWMAAFVQLASGFFVGAATAELQVVAFMTIDQAATGGASTLFNVQRQVASALGVAITASVLAAAGPGLGSYHLAMVTSAGFAIIGALLALRVTESVVLQREPVAAGR